MINNGKRALAHTERIAWVEPIEGADNIEMVGVLGWNCIAKKGEFKSNDLCVYIEIDSKVDETNPAFEFLASKGYKVKTMKLGKFKFKDGPCISQGLALPLEAFLERDTNLYEALGYSSYSSFKGNLKEGVDVTDALKITYAVAEDNARKNSDPDAKYKSMAARHQKIFKKKWARWMMRREWGRNVMFLFFGKKKDKPKEWPVGKFKGVSKTDQERCLFPKTKIKTDHGMMEISNIVNNKLNVKVLSMNESTHTLEYKNIIGYQKIENDNNLITIRYKHSNNSCRSNSLCCTKDHACYTNNGYITADKLCVGDTLYAVEQAYDINVLEPIYGMLLGDSHISQDKRSDGRIRIVSTNGENQLDYLNYKKQIFDQSDGKIVNAGIGSFGKKPSYHYSMNTDAIIDYNCKKDWLVNGKKTVTASVIKKITPISLAFWYMDDGSLAYRDKSHTPQIRLNTQGFSKQENDLLCDMLNNNFGIGCNVRNDKDKYYIIYIHTDFVNKFLEIVTPYMCKSMAYKTLPEYENLIASKILKYKKEERIVPINIVSIENGQKKNARPYYKYVYDITVEDNHNFFADGVLTHNCENMIWVLNDKTPFIKTQKCDGSSGTYILERKKHNKFEFYVCSRNVRMLKPDQNCFYEKNYYWEVATKYDIENKMKDYLVHNPDIDWVCWQGEICAPSIQKNPHKLKETHFYCFHMTDSKNGRFDIRNAANIWEKYKMEVVPIIDENYILPDDFNEFKLSADGMYDVSVCEGNDKCPREGFVYYKTTEPTFSFKNISREYLLKHNG